MDIVQLTNKALRTYKDLAEADEQLKTLRKSLNSPTAGTDLAIKYATRAGELASQALQLNITIDGLGQIPHDVADSVLRAVLGHDYNLVSSATETIEANLFSRLGVGIKPLVPKINEDRLSGLVTATERAETQEALDVVLGEKVVTFSNSVADEGIKQNAYAAHNAGFDVTVVRRLGSAGEKNCKWCTGLAGSYDLEGIDTDVFKRHDRCGCSVEVVYSDGRRTSMRTSGHGFYRGD